MVDVGHRVLPQLRFFRDQWAEVAAAGAHVAVEQLEPRLGEGVLKICRVLEKALRNRRVDRVHPQREVCCEHEGGVLLGGVVSVRHHGRVDRIHGLVLRLAGGALRQLPLVVVQVLHEVVVPPGGVGGPGAFQAAGDRVAGLAAAEAASPAQALRLYAGALRLGADVGLRGGAMRLAERVPAGDERNRLLVVHRHAGERGANVLRREIGVGVAVRPLGVDVNQAHVVGAEGALEFAVGVVALVVKPRRLMPPVGLVRLPDIRASKAKPKGLEAHRLQGAVAGEDDEVGPREGAAVLLLDRPQQAARLVQVPVVRPAVQRRKALVA